MKADQALQKLLKKYKPEDLAPKLGVGKASVYRWRAGSHRISALAAARIVDFFSRESLKAPKTEAFTSAKQF